MTGPEEMDEFERELLEEAEGFAWQTAGWIGSWLAAKQDKRLRIWQGSLDRLDERLDGFQGEVRREFQTVQRHAVLTGQALPTRAFDQH